MTTSHLITTPSHQHIDKRTDKRKYRVTQRRLCLKIMSRKN